MHNVHSMGGKLVTFNTSKQLRILPVPSVQRIKGNKTLAYENAGH